MSFKFDLLFEVEVPRPWTEGKEAAKFHQAIEQAVLADRMGFDTVWIVEHHFLKEFAHSSAPEVMLGALAMKTERIRLGHGVVLMLGEVNHPIRVAERAATIDILSNGRFEMGTGRSSSPYQIESIAVDLTNTRAMWEEGLHLLPKLWASQDMTYEGRFYNWSDKITVLPKPIQQPHPPLWVASTQPDTCAIAGEHGIGLLCPAIAPPETFTAHVKNYKDAVANPRQVAGEFVNDAVGLFTVTFCHDDDDRARYLGGSAGLWYINTVAEIYKNDWRGWDLEKVPEEYRYHAEMKRRGRGVNTATGIELRNSEEKTWTDLIDSGAFCVGSPEKVIEKVDLYRRAGADRLVSVMQLADLKHEDLMRSIELMGTEVIPAVRAMERAEASPGT
ncbi:MAG: LLM class flavin-dependent oxidoreductase [Proteobacteria bacterium]|nr:LLM class flavin-dependent oxidoreductase [Pseudomonadota bacterium]